MGKYYDYDDYDNTFFRVEYDEDEYDNEDDNNNNKR